MEVHSCCPGKPRTQYGASTILQATDNPATGPSTAHRRKSLAIVILARRSASHILGQHRVSHRCCSADAYHPPSPTVARVVNGLSLRDDATAKTPHC